MTLTAMRPDSGRSNGREMAEAVNSDACASEVACVGDLRAGRWTHRRRRHGGQRRRVAIQGQELHLEGSAVVLPASCLLSGCAALALRTRR